MTTLELYRKHKKGEIGRDRFLYEVRRDNNLPWITNITSYDDAVKILKNKGIIKEAQFEPQNIATDPLVDRVNPYALKREVEKLLSKETELTNDSYKQALNKAAKKLTTPEAVKKAMFANADTVEKADAKLQMQPVKKANHLDKNNSMKKVKGQEMPKATAAPTGENKKTKKPKGVEIMKDKGVEGSEKVLREAALTELQSYLKRKLRINEEERHDYHLGQEVHLPGGDMGKIVEMIGGTCVVEMEDGSQKHFQLNVLNRAKNEAMTASEQATEVKEEVVDDNNRGFQNGDKIKITSELSRYRGAIGEIHDLHDDGTAMVILDDPKRTAITVDLSHVRKLRPDELGEAADVVSYTDAASGQKKVAGIYPAGKGSKEAMGLKTMGVTSAKVDQAK